MKRLNTILSICVLFLLSFNVSAQQTGKAPGYGGGYATGLCGAEYGVDVSIERLIWDAGPCDWAQFTGATVTDNGTVPSFPSEFPTSFNAVILDIDYKMYFGGTAAHYRFDINLYQYGGSNKPVLILYKDKPGKTAGGIEAIKDGNDIITGFEITPAQFGGNGGGLSTVVVAGRSGKQASARDGMYLVVTGRIGTSTGNISCSDSNIYDVNWNGITGASGSDCSAYEYKVAQDSEDNIPDVNIYPNPAQDNLFVETAELEINNIALLTLDGQTLNHKVSIRQGIDRTQINTSQLSPGIYILNIETSTDNILKKIIVH